MPSSSADLPPWLRRSGAAQRATKRRGAATAAFALLVFGAGAGAGFLYGHREVAVAPPPPPPAPVCPPPVACAPTPTGTGLAHATHVAPASKRAKPIAKAALSPLPDKPQLDEGARTQALRAFAEKKAPELRDCVAEPDRGPPLKLGAAFEIGWKFPEELLRGDEKLLVNFVL
jgi:hypothetical protein